jgi:hypothetical protein
MHLPREPTLVAQHARQTAHTTLGRSWERATVTVNADVLIAADTVVTGRLARYRFEQLEFCRSRLVIVAMIALGGWPFASVRVEVVHIAHFDLLDALQSLPVAVKGWVDALSFLVMTADWQLDHA